MNWLEAYVLYDDGEYGVESLNLANVNSIAPSDDDFYNLTQVMFIDGTILIIKGYYKTIRDQVANLKDGESAITLDDIG